MSRRKFNKEKIVKTTSDIAGKAVDAMEVAADKTEDAIDMTKEKVEEFIEFCAENPIRRKYILCSIL